MSRVRRSDGIRPSVLDRLLAPPGSPGHPSIGLREVKFAVARDLEWLLNTTSLLLRDEAVQCF